MNPYHQRQEPQAGPELGFRSPFVLAKIGHDLRSVFDDVMSEPMPETMSEALRRLGADEDEAAGRDAPSGGGSATALGRHSPSSPFASSPLISDSALSLRARSLTC